MQSSIPEVVGQQDAAGKYLDIAGFLATIDPRLFANAAYDSTVEDSDARSLAKLWHCGLNVASLEEAHSRFKISPLRTVGDVYKLLGYADNPKLYPGQRDRKNLGDDYQRVFTEQCLTSLAFQFPDPQRRGEVYPHTKIIRVRYPTPVPFPVHNPAKKDHPWTVEGRKYSQPAKKAGDQRSAGEPYFLFKPDMWDKIHDVNRPLYITESELKAVSLGLAGHAAIGFSGVTMWGSPKGKKHQLHPAIDPHGPWGKSKIIPVVGRQIVVMFDTEMTPNAMVTGSAKSLAKALTAAGAASVRIATLPSVVRDGATGVDDFLHHHLGDRWSGDVDKLERARELIEEIAAAAEGFHSLHRYKAYSIARSAQRILDKLSSPQKFTYYEVNREDKEVQMLMYNGVEYVRCDVSPSVGSTSGKVIVNDVELQRMARNAYEEGVNLDVVENGDDDKIEEMPTDFPQKVWAELRRDLPRFEDGAVTGDIPGRGPGDSLIRVKNGLVNLTKCLDEGVTWESRGKWLIDPHHGYLTSGCVDLQIPNQLETPECPHFLAMLDNGFEGDQERITCLQRFMGKVICNPVFHDIQKFLCLFGKAGGGKSTVVEILSKLIGAASVQAMKYHSLGDHDTSSLPGKRLLVFPETGGGDDGSKDKFSPQVAALIKSVSSGELIPCNRKQGAIFSAAVRAEIILVSNAPPVIPMDRQAFLRRAVFLRWSKSIPEDRMDYAVVRHMLTKEITGIFLWALRGAMALKQIGQMALVTPEYCRDDLEDTTEDVDPVATFVREQLRVVKEPAKVPLPVATIREHFLKWMVIARVSHKDVSVGRIGHQITQIYGQKSVNLHDGKHQVRSHRHLELCDPNLRKAREKYGNDAY